MANDHTRSAHIGQLDPQLADHELARLSQSEEATVRAGVAAHPHTPLTIILKLARDDASAVRAGVARNPRTDIPEDVLGDLAMDRAAEVVFALIANDSVAESVVARAGRSKHKDASRAAKEKLSTRRAKRGFLGGLPGFRS